MRASPRAAALLLFGSGLCALVYQTAWQRMFRLVFGASTAASAAVLAIFLGGLGLGGALLGKRVEQSERPLSFYGNLEAVVALLAAVSPFVVGLLSHVYYALGGSAALGTVGATLVRLVIATIVMGPAVVLMGGTLPAAARFVETQDDASRGRLATLYAVNTLGAVVGALLGTFMLFELLGTRMSLWVAVLINLLVALVARALGRTADAIPAVTAPSEEAAKAASASEARESPAWLVYLAAGAVGFAFVCLELVWYRMLAPILGGSSFTFGLVLAVALAGIGVGGYLYARSAKADASPSIALLGLTIGLEALLVAVPLALGDAIAFYAAYTRPMAAVGFTALVSSWAVTTMVVVFPAAVVAGYQFPVLFALLGRGRDRVARQVGLTYAFNTVGSILGALLGGFILVPRLGSVGTWRGVIWLLIAISVGTLVFALVRSTRRSLGMSFGGAVCVALAALCVRAEGPTAAWRHSAIGAGRANIADLDKNGLEAWRLRHAGRLFWEQDGVESSVGVTNDEGLAFFVNGKSDGAVISDRGTQAMLAVLPAMLHENPKSVFVLGLGTGMSAGWVGSIPGIERVDVAELEPAVLRLARQSSKANHAVLDNPKVHVTLGDGRELLLTSKRRYDVIASEPSNPYRAGVASLFTQEFYAVAAERLNPHGLFAQWIQGYEIDAQTLRIALRSIRTAFPFVEIWQTQSDDFVLLASREARTYDMDRLRARIAQPPFPSLLPRVWLVSDIEGVFSHFLVNDKLAAGLGNAFEPPLNTDDDTVLEYAFARQVGSDGLDAGAELTNLAVKLGADRPQFTGSLDWARAREQRPRAWMISRENAAPLAGETPEGAAREHAIRAGCTGKAAAIMPEWQKQSATPRDPIELYVVAEGMAQTMDPHALDLAARLEASGFRAEAKLVEAHYRAQRGEAEQSVALAVEALAELRTTALSLCSTANQVMQLLQHMAHGKEKLVRIAVAALQKGPLAVYAREETRVMTLQILAAELPEPQACVSALGAQLEKPWWDGDFLRERMKCLQRAGHPLAGSAQADMIRYLSNTAGRLEAGLE